ncbi:FKBP-type peptidyl-prolyl cis-trans isomerase [Pelagibaculum spongiae]|uniref:Peptidyl-prolyl cis-trans isomerase n=1 Tax=Pelagibaculum spongiae TaxID=2080658 RepID=A0A2V1GVG3_9GAMM|nr:FKBP-type peptidyl-prolyl cis-trans isomerase [Pelagibaculum spongiae]PVZ68331.1 peptidylprolyl isomerase [Pelagibaculum spongiae]
MKRLFLASGLVLGFGLVGCQSGDDKTAEAEAAKPAVEAAAPAAELLKTDLDKVSYSIGMNIGDNLRKNLSEADMTLLVKGLQDSFSGKELLLSQEDAQNAMFAFQQKKMEEERAKQEQELSSRTTDATTFFTENGKTEGVITLDSGVQYKILTEGKGAKPQLADTVTTHYEGTLLNGDVFDSSYERGEPVSFPLQGVIKGWTEVLQLMPVGSTWEVYIPAELGYGNRPAGKIPAGSALKFKIELISIAEQKAEDKKAG